MPKSGQEQLLKLIRLFLAGKLDPEGLFYEKNQLFEWGESFQLKNTTFTEVDMLDMLLDHYCPSSPPRKSRWGRIRDCWEELRTGSKRVSLADIRKQCEKVEKLLVYDLENSNNSKGPV